MAAEEQLGARARFVRLALAFGLLALAGPGVLARDGNVWLAVVALALWSLTAARPGKRALTIEWTLLAFFFAGQIWWIGYVLPAVVPLSGLVMGGWSAIGGVVLRRLAARGFPFALAAPLAWSCGEGIHHALPIPFSWGWMRVGHLAAGEWWLVGSARVWGAVGLTLVIVGVGGALADLVARRRRAGAVGLVVWPAVAALAQFTTSPPATQDGPTLLLVQPGIPMARKQGADMRELLDTQLEITRSALVEHERAGLAPPDAVVWAETMLPIALLAPGTAEAIEAGGVELAPWHGEPQDLLFWPDVERDLVEGRILAATLPKETAFLAGAEQWVVKDGRVRRTNVGALWQRDRPRQTAPKTYLVIGGETSFGLDGVGFVRDFADGMAGYVPDLLAGERTEVLELARGSQTFHLATTVCFDNAFMRPYWEPLTHARVDAHVVLSNEAWYRESFEFDQMMAFTKVAAAATGRAIARATNSGVTALVGPDGRELARLERDGRDREVAGSLTVVVPVPVRAAADSAAAAETTSDDLDLAPPFVRLGLFGTRALALLALAAGPLLCLVRRRRAPETAR